MAKATYTKKGLKLQFVDGIVVHFSGNEQQFRMTTSCPLLLADIKKRTERGMAFRRLEQKKPTLEAIYRVSEVSSNICDLIDMIS